jgi:hypothetical protein
MNMKSASKLALVAIALWAMAQISASALPTGVADRLTVTNGSGTYTIDATYADETTFGAYHLYTDPNAVIHGSAFFSSLLDLFVPSGAAGWYGVFIQQGQPFDPDHLNDIVVGVRTAGDPTGFTLGFFSSSSVGGISESFLANSGYVHLGGSSESVFGVSSLDVSDFVADRFVGSGESAMFESAGGTPAGVPDGGSTAGLIGLAFISVVALRRKLA